MERKTIDERIEEISPYDWEGDIEEVAERIATQVRQYKKQYSSKYSSLRFGVDARRYSDGDCLWLRGCRLETEKEHNNRVEQERVRKEYRRKEYEALKKELEGK